VVELLVQIRRKAPACREDSREADFRAQQNALAVKNAEADDRAMVQGGPESWNIRDRPMIQTLARLALYRDQTQALHALPVRRAAEEEVPETLPCGV
jgi:erythromycin esterase